MRFDIDGSGEREYAASAYTMLVYEQEFGRSLIKDFYGKVDLRDADGQLVTADYVERALSEALPEGKRLPKATSELVRKAFPAYVTAVIDYTQDNWEAGLRCMWAMMRTADEAAGAKTVPYRQWVAGLGPVNMSEVSQAVYQETQRGLFRARG